ncbi:carboxypeptidase B-like isoform X1 [Hemiscyllium ocellatum]|uniref:carboxypeptidase B-like isoform X1 n=1 Tax=Hemiscyllium ocellatum TaxID=170820 RepID=UPI00296619BF|nr:carboxypeptidase B-like isoform X1 [Hemiscyllium ocellatum]
MKIFCLLGLVTAVLADPAVQRFDGEKVFRLKPTNDQALWFVKGLADFAKVDFWKPDSIDQVTVGVDVDFRVGAQDVVKVQKLLEQSGLEYEVLIEDLQEMIEQQLDNKERSASLHSYVKYNDLDTINAWITNTVLRHSNLMSLTEIGTSYEGRSIYVIKIGKKTNQPKPAIFMDCGIHAREWISPAFCQWFVKEAVSTYGSDPIMTKVLDTMDFFVVPVINVDGYAFTWSNNRMWRKTRSRTSGSYCRGVDPNRNWDAGWCTVGASRNPCDETYCGPRVESEKEVQAVANFIRLHKESIKAYLTMHSYSQMCLFPYSYTYDLAANHNELNNIAKGAIRKLASLYGTQYTYGPGATTIYLAAGGSDDWAYDLGIKYSFTFELRDTGRYGFLLPESQIQPTCEETMLAIKYVADYVVNNLY